MYYKKKGKNEQDLFTASICLLKDWDNFRQTGLKEKLTRRCGDHLQASRSGKRKITRCVDIGFVGDREGDQARLAGKKIERGEVQLWAKHMVNPAKGG